MLIVAYKLYDTEMAYAYKIYCINILNVIEDTVTAGIILNSKDG